jgi:hypothetical protein
MRIDPFSFAVGIRWIDGKSYGGKKLWVMYALRELLKRGEFRRTLPANEIPS